MRTRIEWCVAYGGSDPENCAGMHVYDDEAEAREDAGWLKESSVWHRTVHLEAWKEDRS